MKRGLIFAVIAAVIAFLLLTFLPSTTKQVVYVVRHAEKITGPNAGKNPDLTTEGKARAEKLAGMLAGKKIRYIHSSDTIRTKDTGAPLANKLGLEILIYNPRDLDALAEKVESMPGNHLIVGHSNTAPETAAALGGKAGDPIVEATEYDRLYKLTIKSKNSSKAVKSSEKSINVTTKNRDVTTEIIKF